MFDEFQSLPGFSREMCVEKGVFNTRNGEMTK